MIFLGPVFAFWQLTSKKKLAKKLGPKHRFPLLKLPRVVLLECIENLDVLEIASFSLLSKRAESIAKLIAKSIPRNLLDIRLRFGGDPKIFLRLPTDPRRVYVIDYNKGKESSEYPYVQSSRIGPKVYNFLFLEDNGNAIEKIKQMAEHICQLFRSQITGITIADESLIEWIINLQSTIRYIWIDDDVVNSVETLDRIFQNLKLTRHFRLKSIDKKIKVTKPIPCPSISIHNSYWFTLPSVLNGTNSIIRLYGSKLTPMDINTILKEWQMGTKLQNLEYLEIETSTLIDHFESAREMLEDLDLTVSVGNDGIPQTIKIDDEWILPLPQEDARYDLIRNDGMIGSFFVNLQRYRHLKVTFISFRFQVWRRSRPRQDNNNFNLMHF
ncbi:Protein CBG13792 [Caenorhabditis briggsae]|uniref:Protein CBG13792 n=1 Tax=Caenorhabditis briggsae TaxID=6238 RepID=A8XIQ0_CAEBR|nr:Protein CBG13792 [Caenorhabditis briggsae]CAP32525.1 Protein CBG13792 [Caenorhabditis briggsae]